MLKRIKPVLKLENLTHTYRSIIEPYFRPGSDAAAADSDVALLPDLIRQLGSAHEWSGV